MAYKRHLIAKTKNLYDGLNHYVVSKNWPADKKIWTGDIAVTCCFSFYQNLSDVNSPSGALFRFEYSDNSISYRVPVNQTGLVRADAVLYPTENKRLIGISIVNYSGSTGDVYNMLLEKGSSMTIYVPYDYLPSYKSKLKVANVCQLLDKSKFPVTKTINGITFTNNGDGTITANGTATANVIYDSGQSISVDQTRIYYSSDMLSINYSGWVSGNNDIGHICKVIAPSQPTKFSTTSYYYFDKDTILSNKILHLQIIDLTEIYGAGHEPTTVAEFRAKFPNELYPYAPKCWLTSYKHNLIATTKNLFKFSTDTVTMADSWDNTAARQFEEDKWYLGISSNNHIVRARIIDYKIERNSIYINGQGSGYGLGRAFKVQPDTAYRISAKSHGSTPELGVGCYNADGTWLLNYEINSDTISFVTPGGCKWMTVILLSPTTNYKIYYGDIQLEKGSTATDYVANGYV